MSVATTSDVGQRMLDFAAALYPICRSITGDGVRETLRFVGRDIDLDIHEVPSGTPVLDWTVPDEWNIRDAFIAEPATGRRIVDFGASNLHVVGYSEPVRAVLTFDQLREHLYVHATEPDWIPYRTSFYERAWGFCVTQRQLRELETGGGPYEVVVDSTLAPGSLTYGECVLRGSTEHEVLLTTHICHPSLANENLSGIAVLTELGIALAKRPRRLTYRLLFIPGTIGSITWLARNDASVEHVVGGLVLACLGDSASLSYKQSRQAVTELDRAAEHVVTRRDGRVAEFEPWGFDERQFNSLGYNLPVGRLARSPEGMYPEYHSSADNLDLIDASQLEGSLRAVSDIVDILDSDRYYVNLAPRGEPQLGRRGFFGGIGGSGVAEEELAALWVLNQADGTQSMLDTAIRSRLPFECVARASERLVRAELLEEKDWVLP